MQSSNEVLSALISNKRCILGIKLGPLSRTAVFTTKVDNGENPSVTDELQAWESAGLTPTVEILQQFARAYALEGNVQGVV